MGCTFGKLRANAKPETALNPKRKPEMGDVNLPAIKKTNTNRAESFGKLPDCLTPRDKIQILEETKT